jgi:hypothetical protein
VTLIITQDDSVLTLEDGSTPRGVAAAACDSDTDSDRGGGGGGGDGGGRSPIPLRALIADNPTSEGMRAIYPVPYTLNHKSITLNPKPWTLNPEPGIPTPRLQILHLEL